MSAADVSMNTAAPVAVLQAFRVSEAQIKQLKEHGFLTVEAVREASPARLEQAGFLDRTVSKLLSAAARQLEEEEDAELEEEHVELEEEDAVLAEALAAPPAGLTAAQSTWQPSRAVQEALIKKIDGNKLSAEAERSLSPLGRAALELLRQNKGKVLAAKVHAALDQCNLANKKTVNKQPKLLQPVQMHAMGSAATRVVCGSFPVTTAMDTEETLAHGMNATVLVVSMLLGHEMPAAFMEATIRTNRMPTTTPGYTTVPSKSDYDLFKPDIVRLLQHSFAAGVQSFDAITDSCRADFEQALYGGAQPVLEVLLERNGATLELHMPPGKPPVLATFPAEHMSHVAWQAMKEETRLWILEGLVAVHAARAALLGSAPPLVDKLLTIVGGEERKGVKGYKGGAYCEAVMKTARRAQFRAVYGDDEGDKRWKEWYIGCKQRAGALRPLCPLSLPRTSQHSPLALCVAHTQRGRSRRSRRSSPPSSRRCSPRGARGRPTTSSSRRSRRSSPSSRRSS